MNRAAGAGGRKLAAWEMNGVMPDYKGGGGRADANVAATGRCIGPQFQTARCLARRAAADRDGMDTALPSGTRRSAGIERPSEPIGINVPEWSFDTST